MPRGIYKNPEERKRKISEKLKGRKLSKEHYEKILKTTFKKGHKGFKGQLNKKFTEEHRKKISESLKKKGIKPIKPFRWTGKKRTKRSKEWQWKITEQISGEKNHNWEGGKWSYLRKIAKTRDDYTCQICGLRDEEIMEVDHIKPKHLFPELKECLENLVTLCPNCHRRKTNRELRQLKTIS